MATRPACRWMLLPLSLQQCPVAKTHEDRIERPRPKPDLQPKFVAIPPRGRVGRQSLKDVHSLRRRAPDASHTVTLPMSRSKSNSEHSPATPEKEAAQIPLGLRTIRLGQPRKCHPSTT